MRTLLMVSFLGLVFQSGAQKRINFFPDFKTIDWSGNECHYGLIYHTDTSLRMDFFNCEKVKIKTESFDKDFNPKKDDPDMFRRGEQLTYFPNGTVSSRFNIKSGSVRTGHETMYDGKGRIICAGIWGPEETRDGSFGKRSSNGRVQIDIYKKDTLKSTILLNPNGDTASTYEYRQVSNHTRIYSNNAYRNGTPYIKILHNCRGLDSIIRTLDTATNTFKVTFLRDTTTNRPLGGVSDEVPSFKGDINQYIRDHIKYPEFARENGIGGKVMVRFVVEADGSVSNVRTDEKNDASLEKEAIRVIQSTSGRWKPALVNGKPIRTQMQIPINFVLQ